MGKTSKKVSKKQQLNKGIIQSKKIEEAKKGLETFKESGQYEEGLLVIIDLLQQGIYDVDIIYMAAELYFMAADYDRAALWVNKTFDVCPGHLAGKLLLARICMLEDRESDAEAIIKVLLGSATAGDLTMEQQSQLKEIAEYFNLDSENNLNTVEVLDKEVLGECDQQPANSITDNNILWEGDEEAVPKGEKHIMADHLIKSPEVLQEEIFSQDVPTMKKIELCNSFAGAFFYEERNSEAKKMLESALALDAYDEMTIRNMISLLLVEEKKEQALEYASKLVRTNFELIKLLK